MKIILSLLLSISLVSVATFAQTLQSPADFLGYELGSQFTYHHRVVDYYEYVAANSDLVKTEEYGTTNERRPLITAFITATENMEILDQLRMNNLIGAGLENGNKKGKQLPIVWLSYNIHGNEAASTEAAMLTLYTLITDKSKANWLKNMIIILDPCENPDGRDRYANWYNQVKNNSPNPNLDSREHHEPWPGGRFNHYLFDLNRDWAWQTQKESRHRIALYHKWMPHVHADLHEMGVNSPYFFAPAAHPYHDVMTKWQNDFQTKVGKNNASYFDKNGWLYFTKEIFDLLYPSYGDTWPIYNGAIGFTYEQGGSGRGGLTVTKETGDQLTLKDRLTHHFTASLSTIETAYVNKDKLISEFNQYFKKGTNNPVGDYKSYVIKGSNNAKTLAAFLDLLDKQNIKYGTAKNVPLKLTGFDYLNNKINNFALESDDIVISAYQSHSRMVKVLMEPKTFIEDSLTYDLTAWALPYAYELESYAVRTKLGLETAHQPAIDEIELPEMPAYGIIAKWDDINDARFLAALMKEKIKVRFSQNPFRTTGQYFKRGTLVITREDNRNKEERYDKAVVKIAEELKVDIYPVESGLVDLGSDFGSGNMHYIKPVKIALVGGNGVTPTAYGEAWHYFEQVLNYPVTILHTDYLSSVDLKEYDVLVLVSGSYGKFTNSFIDYARGGGKIIAIEGAIRSFSTSNKTALGTSSKKDNGNSGRRYSLGYQKTYGDRERQSASYLVAGSIYKVHLDETHPLAFGNDKTVHLMKRNRSTFPLISNGEWNVGIFKKDSHISGFVGHKLKAQIPNTLALGVERMGSGNIIYFSDSPIIRGFWHSGKLLLANAIFFVGN